MALKTKKDRLERRHLRVRKKTFGVPERPRLSVFRSLNHVYAQIIDDSTGKTLAAASSVEKEFKEKEKTGGNMKAAGLVGKMLAERALAKGIKQVAFDRGGFIYHGRVKALAESAREGGLDF